MKDILIVSNYFPPETGAAANRISTIATGLKQKDWKVSILCPLPNYPNGKIFEGYQNKIIDKRVEKDIEVNRIWVYPSNSKNKIIRLISMLSFSFSLSLFLLFKKTSDKIIVQSPPLFVAFFAILCSKLKRKKIILNVSDLWPLAGKELGAIQQGFGYRMLEKIERFNYRNSHLIMGQSKEICTHIANFTSKKIILYRNYPKFDIDAILNTDSYKVHIIYAGLLGVAQGIVDLCKKIELPNNVVLDIYGNGAEKQEIQDYINNNPQKNIFYHGELTRTELHKVLTEKADYALIPLVNRIYGSVPSKIFEMANIGLPMIYMGGGEGGDIVRELKLGQVVEPQDYNSLNKILTEIQKVDQLEKQRILTIAKQNFSFDNQLEVIDKEIKEM